MDNRHSLLVTAGISLALVCLILAAGCSSSTTQPTGGFATQTIAPAPVTSAQTPEQAPAAPTVASTAATTAATAVPVKTISLSSDMTLAYPSDWEMETPGDTALRDYGQYTKNLANFYSPTVNGKYTTVSVDLDPQQVEDNDQYFNLATVAVQNYYGTIQITHHSQLSNAVSMISACSVCKHYNLEFDTKTLDKWYHFIDDDGTFYIFSVNNPDLNHDQVMELLKSVKITPVTQQKHR